MVNEEAATEIKEAVVVTKSVIEAETTQTKAEVETKTEIEVVVSETKANAAVQSIKVETLL